MKAIVRTKYGQPDVLGLKEKEKPVPGDDEVLVRVYAASLNMADWHLLTADIFLIRLMGLGFFRPKITILGADIAGRIEAVGRNITQFKPGDDVFGDLSGCGFGGLAEYVCAAQNSVAIKPANLSYAQAAAVPLAAMTALHGLRDVGHIQAGQRVLINGASGGVGTYAVQLARHFGAEVTAVCSSRNLDTARSIGADHVIDYTKEDFTRNKKKYDLIMAANGYHSLADYRRALSPSGIYVMSGGKGAQMFQVLLLGPLLSKKGGRKLTSVSSKPVQKDLYFLKELLEAGKIKPVIDKEFPLEDTPAAMRYLGEGHARGKIVITV